MLTIVGMEFANDDSLVALIEQARREDLGTGDLSTQLLSNADEPATFQLIARQPCVFAGVEIAQPVLNAYDESLILEWSSGVSDGYAVEAPDSQLAELRGRLGSLLSAERVLLNFLQRLCGIATLTHRYVQAVRGTDAKIFDTRKTTPGWRLLEKYAVRCGGGCNHRMGLYDTVLLKDNHLERVAVNDLAGYVRKILRQLEEVASQPVLTIAEADTLDQARRLFEVENLDVVLLDNFSLPDLKTAVKARDTAGLRGRLELEASGGVTIQTVTEVAQTGVDRISIGALTHSATAVDLSLERR